MILLILIIMEAILAIINALFGAKHFRRSERDYNFWLDEIDEEFKKGLIEEIKRQRFLAGFYFLMAGFLCVIINIQAI